ncbi:type I-E CRISPR-associated protein Cas7/Cse4/CasC [Streptomyces triticirhizae]|uniref:CRISPR-associated protein n=1 Tax=Streptomyces triticirhizae TaxID=2483353 RepID=A0A3M2LTA3_9ACTN|nr:type I-E CRISPR-associated protein Cas7/Cse4/CasC [Streptomyces triticirhizae]RMI40472.1 CRISPR-associated protein [Streptomyces triticirhizae]
MYPYLNLHALATFSGVLLNRDENNLPKVLQYGGTTRTRISAQCYRRAERMYLRSEAAEGRGPLRSHAFGTRTREWARLTAARLVERGWPEPEARETARQALRAAGLKFGQNDSDLTKVLLFAPEETDTALAEVLDAHREELATWLREETARAEAHTKSEAKKSAKGRRGDSGNAAEGETEQPPAGESGEGGTSGSGDVSTTMVPLPKEVKARLLAAFDPGAAMDIALFGRMLAEIVSSPNVDGAIQSSHAFTVDESVVTEDFYTAVDDSKDRRKRAALDVFDDDSGAGMTGYQSLVSGTFLRSTTLDRRQLRLNLARAGMPGDRVERAARSAELAYVDAFVNAVPAAKSTTTGGLGTQPKLVLAFEAERPIHYAAAFERALTAKDGPVSLQAVRRLLAQHRLVCRRREDITEGSVLTYDLDVEELLTKLRVEDALSARVVESPLALVAEEATL